MTKRQPKKLECKSDIGQTVGLIDSLIFVARAVGQRLDYSAMSCGETGDKYQPIRDALTDLCTTKELRDLMGKWDGDAMKIIHDAAALLKTRAAA